MPYGWHCMFVGTDEDNVVIKVPMAYDGLLQALEKAVRSELIELLADWLQTAGASSLLKDDTEAPRRWLSRAA